MEAQLVESREILPGQWLQTWDARWLSGVRAGQFVHLRIEDAGLLLRRPLTVNTVDRASGRLTLHVRATGRGSSWLTRARPADTIEMLGPVGRGWEVDPRSLHLLLIAEEHGIAGVRLLADEALEAGRQVVLLFGAPTAAEVYPSALLPDEVEYVVATADGSLGHAGTVADLVQGYEAWADQAFASASVPTLATLARLARGRDGRLGVARLGRKRGGRRDPLGSAAHRRGAWLQVLMRAPIACAVGSCLGCVVWGVDGPQRVCREGPAFASEEIAWEEDV